MPDDVAERELSTVDPARIAEFYWDMYVHRDRVEELVGRASVLSAPGTK